MKIAVISDIHSNLDAFETVIASLPEYDSLICLGDVVGYGPQPNEVVEQLQRLQPTAVLMGNHDYAVATGDTTGFSPHAAVAVEWTRRQIKEPNLQYLAGLHPSGRIDIGGISLAIFHGSPRDPLSEYVLPGIPEPLAKRLIQKAGAPVVLLGHTHMPMVYSFGGEMLANPGSVGQPRDGDPRSSFGILKTTEGNFSFNVTRVEYNIESVASKISRADLPPFLAERLYIGM